MLPGHGASSGRSLVSSEAQCGESGRNGCNPDAAGNVYADSASHSNGRGNANSGADVYPYPGTFPDGDADTHGRGNPFSHGGGNAYRGAYADSDGQSDTNSY